MDYPKKHALRKLTKSEKRQAMELREEIGWLERVGECSVWPFNVPASGEKYRQLCLYGRRLQLDKIYDANNRVRG